MQLFGSDGNDDSANTVIGDYEIKVKKASTLALGTHSARFYPLSRNFYEGADNVSTVQFLHWLNKRPIVCGATSYDYTGDDRKPRMRLNSECIICSDKFVAFKKAKALGFDRNKPVNSPEAINYSKLGSKLMEKVSASSIVSFIDSNGNLLPPVILRYGKELLTQLELHVSRILNSPGGVHISDPFKGYMFDITIGKNDGGYRTYKNSMPAVNTSPVDITTAPWDWKEVAEAIKGEYLTVSSQEEVLEFYTKNFEAVGSTETQAFNHPALGTQNVKEQKVTPVFTPPGTVEEKVVFTPPAEDKSTTTFVKTDIPVSEEPKLQKALSPCHASNGTKASGYDSTDKLCQPCPQAESCYEATKSRNTSVSEVAVETNESTPGYNSCDIESKLAKLNKQMSGN